MDPLNPTGLITAGVDLVGGIVSANQARKAFKTRYQDTVNDMKKAGLNPALAYGQGGGNPTTVPLPEVGTSYQKGVATSASAKQARANQELTEAQTNLLRAQTAELSKRPFLENQALQFGMKKTEAETTNVGAQTDWTRLRSVGQQMENVGTQTRNDILALEQILRENDVIHSNATLLDRVKATQLAARQAGVNVGATEIANVLAGLKIPEAQLRADLITTARQGQSLYEQIGGGITADLSRISEGVRKWWDGVKERAKARQK
jgi:hypothetical protein